VLTIKEINQAIMFGQLSNEELCSVIDAVKFARTQLGKETKRNLTIGLPVKFTSTKHGRTITGTVSKINRKFIIVREAPAAGRMLSTAWRVPANMLEVA